MHIHTIELLRTFYIQAEHKLRMKIDSLPIRSRSHGMEAHLKGKLMQGTT